MASKSSTSAALCSACRASLVPFTLPLRQSIRATYRPSRLRSLQYVTSNSTSSNCNALLRRRTYATTSRPPNDSSSSSDPFANTLPPWPSSPEPTPYEIFGMNPRDPYTKRRFHQLVKFYHPDMSPSSSSSSTISQATRTERYRLVVAANDLLSDPSRRQLYDLHATGWLHDGRSPDLRERDRAWRHQPNTAARNATWEDWEAWHQEQRRRQYGGEPPKPVYMSNGMFAGIVVALCFVGALAQRSRAETVGGQYVDFAQDQNADIGRQMQRATYAAAGRSREERIDSFVRERENVAYRYRPGRFEEEDAAAVSSPALEEQQQQQKQQQQQPRGIQSSPS